MMEPRHFWVLLNAQQRSQAAAQGTQSRLSRQDIEDIRADLSGAKGRWF